VIGFWLITRLVWLSMTVWLLILKFSVPGWRVLLVELLLGLRVIK
jgi:hypothetical protein